MNFTSLKEGFRLVGWQLSSLTAAVLFMCSVSPYPVYSSLTLSTNPSTNLT